MTQFKRSIAIIIGVNQYQNGVPALKTAVNDAIAIGQVLKADHDYQVVLLRDQQVSLVTLRSLLTDKRPALVQPDDRVLFYFAGHGLAFNGDDGPEGYLIPQDAKLGDSTTYLPMTLVHDSLTALPCRHFLGIFDCCFAGAFRWSATRRLSPIPQVIHKERFARFLTDPAWQVITSAADDQEAMDALSIKDHRGVVGRHSPFAEALIKALQADSQADASPPSKDGKPSGDGVITATELYQYLRDAVEPDTTAHAMRQTPGLWPLKNHGKGEFVFMVPGRQPDLPNAPQLNEAANPYRGLEAFEEQHQHLFFGRKQLIQDLQAFAETHPLTIVLGASGTGKSSLVKAGLVPALKQDLDADGQPIWQVLPIMRPGITPLKAILQTLPGPDLVATLADLDPKTWADHLSQSLEQWRQANPQRRLLLVVDQAEELFSLCRDGVQRQQFLDILAQLLDRQAEQFHVILTLRSDFEPQFRNSPLEEHWACDRFTIRPMNREELRAAIEAPASAKVMYFEPPSLVDRLIDEVTEMPGALPLLSFTLRELFLKYLRSAATRTNRAITEADYEALGGIKQALVNRAEEEYHALVDIDPAFATAIRQVMLRLVATSGTGNTRRQVLLSELDYPEPEGARVQQVLTRFKEARLLVGDTTADEQPYVEPAHDALVEGWPRLLQWLESDPQAKAPAQKIRKERLRWLPAQGNSSIDASLDEREKLLLQRRLTPAANDWQRQQSAKFLWHADPRLPLLRQLRQREPHWFNRLEKEFVQRSIAQKHRNTRLRWLALGLSAGAIAIAVLGFRDIQQRAALSEADSQRQQVLTKANESISNALNDQPLRAYENALRAYYQVTQHQIADRVAQLSVYSALIQATFGRSAQAGATENPATETGFRMVNQRPLQSRIVRVAVNPADNTLALAGEDEIHLWREDQTPRATLEHPGVSTLRYGADGSQLASGSRDGTLRLWRWTKGNPDADLLMITQHADTTEPIAISDAFGYNLVIRDVLFSADGSRLFSVQGDGSVKVWSTATGELVAAMEVHDGRDVGVSTLSTTADGELLASAEWNTVHLWRSADLQTQGADPVSTRTVDSEVTALALSPGGETLATGHYGGALQLWDVEERTTLALRQTIQADSGWVTSLGFTPDGETLISTGDDNDLKLWRPADGAALGVLRGHSNRIIDSAMDADGTTLHSLSSDNTLRTWAQGGTDRVPAAQVTAMTTGFPLAIAMHPDGSRYALLHNPDSAVPDLEIWSVEGQRERILTIGDLTGFGSSSLHFSPDGHLLVLTSPAGTLELWDLRLPDSQPFQTIDGEPRLNTMAFNQQGDEMVTAGFDGTVRHWHQTKNGRWETLNEFDFCPREAVYPGEIRANAIAFSPDDRHLAIASQDGRVWVWPQSQWRSAGRSRCLEASQPLQNTPVSASQQPTHGHIFFTADGRLAVATGNDRVNLWQLDQPDEPEQSLQPNTDGVFALAHDPQTGVMAIAGGNGRIELWSEAGNFLQSLSGHSRQMQALSISTTHSRLVSVDVSYEDYTGNLRLWTLDPAQLAQVGCQRIQGVITSNPDSNQELSDFCSQELESLRLFSDRAADPSDDSGFVLARSLAVFSLNRDTATEATAFQPFLAHLDLSGMGLSLTEQRTFYQLHSQIAVWDLTGSQASLTTLRGSQNACVSAFAIQLAAALDDQGTASFSQTIPIKRSINQTPDCRLPLFPYDSSF